MWCVPCQGDGRLAHLERTVALLRGWAALGRARRREDEARAVASAYRRELRTTESLAMTYERIVLEETNEEALVA